MARNVELAPLAVYSPNIHMKTTKYLSSTQFSKLNLTGSLYTCSIDTRNEINNLYLKMI